MRSAFFESRPLRLAASLALVSALALPQGLQQPAAARGPAGWLRGVFPVASFAGYTSPFGMRSHPLSGDRRQHFGIDIAGPLGSPVRSWWHGTVTEVIRDGGCGNGLTLRSGDYEHIYCHLAGSVEAGWYRSGSVLLRAGERVRAGQVIGHIGLTGSTTGPHLHWGMRYRGTWMDPARVLRAMAASRRAVASGDGSGTTTRRRPLSVGVLR
jgi:murein DD-endopeptidase MepM/ murein hydrolase activator NlpD